MRRFSRWLALFGVLPVLAGCGSDSTASTRKTGPPPAKPQTAQEIYDELKIPDSVLSGSYANGVMIGHTASEFKLDFLSNLFPHSAVSARVFLSSPQVPRLLESLDSTWVQFQQRLRQQQQQPPRTPPPPTNWSSEDQLG